MDFLVQQTTARRKARRLRRLFVVCALAGLPIACLTVAILLSFVTLIAHTLMAAFLDWEASSAGLMPLRPFVALFPGSWRSFSQLSVQIWTVIDVLATIALLGWFFYKLHQGHRASSFEHLAGDIGAVELRNRDEDIEERQLVNIVDEMSVASGIAPPRVFTWGETAGINAFSRGDSAAAAEVYVSRGALELLNREETQALVAHEISRILNADQGVLMRMSGASFLSYGSLRFGRWMLRFPKRGKFPGHWFFLAIKYVLWLVYLPFALVLWLAGSLQFLISWVFTHAVLSQQITAADAFALQFTRNSVAMRNLLMKVAVYGGDVGGNSASAEDLEHVCFASLTRRKWFNSHPSIPARLRALDARYRDEELVEFRERFASKRKLLEIETRNAEAARLARERQRRRAVDAARVSAAAVFTIEIGDEANNPEPLPSRFIPPNAAPNAAPATGAPKVATPEAERARGRLLALLLDPAPDLRSRQLDALRERGGDTIANSVASQLRETQSLSREHKSIALDALLPALRDLPSAQARSLLALIPVVHPLDANLGIFEYVLGRVAAQFLRDLVDPKPPHGEATLAALPSAVSALLGVLTQLGTEDERQASAAYELGMRHALGTAHAPFRPVKPWAPVLNRALHELSRLQAVHKQKLLEAMNFAVLGDGRISEDESQLTRAIAVALRCPRRAPSTIDSSLAATL